MIFLPKTRSYVFSLSDVFAIPLNKLNQQAFVFSRPYFMLYVFVQATLSLSFYRCPQINKFLIFLIIKASKKIKSKSCHNQLVEY